MPVGPAPTISTSVSEGGDIVVEIREGSIDAVDENQGQSYTIIPPQEKVVDTLIA